MTKAQSVREDKKVKYIRKAMSEEIYFKKTNSRRST